MYQVLLFKSRRHLCKGSIVNVNNEEKKIVKFDKKFIHFISVFFCNQQLTFFIEIKLIIKDVLTERIFPDLGQ